MHFVLTIQWTGYGALSVATNHGLITDWQGHSREKLFSRCLEQTRKDFGVPDGIQAAVLHWSCELNEPAQQ